MKNWMIFGDSYSTHRDHIPVGYPAYYCDEGRSEDAPVTKMLACETWWWRLLESTGARLIQNNSWSGSTICYTGYHGDCSGNSSFICRYKKLLANGFFETNAIDTILVFGGTNDSWADAPLGEEQYEDFRHEDLFSVLPAICYLMGELRRNHPTARVVFIANCDIKPEIVEGMRNAAARLGAECIVLHDINKESGHPTVRGMAQIYEQVSQGLEDVSR